MSSHVLIRLSFKWIKNGGKFAQWLRKDAGFRAGDIWFLSLALPLRAGWPLDKLLHLSKFVSLSVNAIRLLQESNEINYVNHLSQYLHKRNIQYKFTSIILLMAIIIILILSCSLEIMTEWEVNGEQKLPKGLRGFTEVLVHSPASLLCYSWGFLGFRSPRVSYWTFT